jgi:site-specific DNA-methyltransferase (cytosine-N4-specific)
LVDVRNRRSVWTVPSKPFSEAHFAVMPEDLVRPCILASTRPGDVVFDPFAGAGTVPYVAMCEGRVGIGLELNPDYCRMARERCAATACRQERIA